MTARTHKTTQKCRCKEKPISISSPQNVTTNTLHSKKDKERIVNFLKDEESNTDSTADAPSLQFQLDAMRDICRIVMDSTEQASPNLPRKQLSDKKATSISAIPLATKSISNNKISSIGKSKKIMPQIKNLSSVKSSSDDSKCVDFNKSIKFIPKQPNVSPTLTVMPLLLMNRSITPTSFATIGTLLLVTNSSNKMVLPEMVHNNRNHFHMQDTIHLQNHRYISLF